LSRQARQVTAASASLGSSKQALADSTNFQQRGESKSNGSYYKKKRNNGYGNGYGSRREDEIFDHRGNGQIQHFSQRGHSSHGNGGGQHTVNFACVEISAGPVGPEIYSECPARIRHRRIDQLWAILNDEFCADVKSVMRELDFFMSEIYDDDIPAEATVVETLEVANITAMLRYESVDANGNANDDLSRQFSVDQPFYCDQNQLTKLLSQEGSSSL